MNISILTKLGPNEVVDKKFFMIIGINWMKQMMNYLNWGHQQLIKLNLQHFLRLKFHLDEIVMIMNFLKIYIETI